MRKSTLLLVSVLGLAPAAPALALDHQLGAVNISADRYTPVTWSRFDGRVARLTLVPETDTVDCTHITVNYRGGDSYDVFDGRLVKDSRETITIPRGNENLVQSVDFACKAQSVDGARIALITVSDGDGPDDGRPAHVRVYQDAGRDGR